MHIKYFQLDLSNAHFVHWSQVHVHFEVPRNLRIRSNSVPAFHHEFPIQTLYRLPVRSVMVPCVEQVGQAWDVTWKTGISGSTHRDKTKYVDGVNVHVLNRTSKDNIDSGYKELLLLQKIVVRSAQLTFAGPRTVVAVALSAWVQVATIHRLSGRRHCALCLSLMETVAPSPQFTLCGSGYLGPIVVNLKLHV